MSQIKAPYMGFLRYGSIVIIVAITGEITQYGLFCPSQKSKFRLAFFVKYVFFFVSGEGRIGKAKTGE